MKRKSILFFILIVFILNIATYCLATENAANNIKNAINNGTNTVIDGTNNLVQDARNGMNSATGAVENTVQNVAGNTENVVKSGENAIDNAGASAYNATVTSAQDMVNGNGMTIDTWTWVFIVAGLILVVGLVYYYTTQKRD